MHFHRFFDLDTMFETTEARDQAIINCKGNGSSTESRSCLFDTAATGNPDIGLATLQTEEENTAAQEDLGKSLYTLQHPSYPTF